MTSTSINSKDVGNHKQNVRGKRKLWHETQSIDWQMDKGFPLNISDNQTFIILK